MIINQLVMILLGMGGGLLVAGGTVALIISLGIIPRLAGITHTAHSILRYEDAILLGSIAGNLVYIYKFNIPMGYILMLFFGIFAGMFLGCWILALADTVNIFPIFARRIKWKHGTSIFIFVLALGKVLGALFHFYNRW